MYHKQKQKYTTEHRLGTVSYKKKRGGGGEGVNRDFNLYINIMLVSDKNKNDILFVIKFMCVGVCGMRTCVRSCVCV